MKRVACAAVFVLLAGIVVAMRPAEGQDNLDLRVSALETRVAALETQVGDSTLPKGGSTQSHTLAGVVAIRGEREGTSHPSGGVSSIDDNLDGTCSGGPFLFDLEEGVVVTVRDGNEATIGMGRLQTGRYMPFSETNGTCELPFTVPDLPDSDFYTVAIGQRDPVSFTREELEQAGWTIEIPIGKLT